MVNGDHGVLTLRVVGAAGREHKKEFENAIILLLLQMEMNVLVLKKKFDSAIPIIVPVSMRYRSNIFL